MKILQYITDMRQRGRLAGFSMYVSNSNVLSDVDIQGSTLCFKDRTQLPPLNFTTICAVKGRYVIYYNERLDGVVYPKEYEVVNVYTELCEVVVQGKQRKMFNVFFKTYIFKEYKWLMM